MQIHVQMEAACLVYVCVYINFFNQVPLTLTPHVPFPNKSQCWERSWDGRSHVRQNRSKRRRPKARPEGLRMCLEDAEEVN